MGYVPSNLRRIIKDLQNAALERSRVGKVRRYHRTRFSRRRLYLIYRDSETAGFFSFLYTFFSEIEFAVSRGLIPVIDMQSYRSQFGVGNGNVWEFLFEQPARVSPAELYAYGDFMHCSGCTRDNGLRLSWDMKWALDADLLKKKKYLFSNYIRPTKALEDSINSHSSIFDGWTSTVGVSLRGTCYVSNKPYGHPVQPSTDSILSKCEHLIESGECDSVYLATIDSAIQTLFVNRFGPRLLKLDRPAYPASADLFRDIEINESMSSHLMAYVTSVFLFRNCTRVLGGVTSSSIFLPLICTSDTVIDLMFMGYYGI
jgi:hypothetical protein